MLTRPDGSTYEGDYVDGKYEGMGSYKWPNGEEYRGHFTDGKRDGQGTHTWPNGNKLEATWRGSVPTHGKRTSPDGAVYEGAFNEKWQRHGNGTRHSADGFSVITGEWRDDRFYTGNAVWKNARGSDGRSEFKEGKPVHRTGRDIWPDGTKYVGDWSYNNEGYSGGTIQWPDGRSYKGAWRVVEGKPDIPEGDGEMSWPDGRKYTGEFKDGLPHGLGKVTYADGRNEDGMWRKGTFAGALVPAQSTETTKPSAVAGRLGTLSVSAAEEDCEVFVDGSPVGSTPAKLRLAEGSHVITVRKSGCNDFERQIRVDEGAELTLKAKLVSK